MQIDPSGLVWVLSTVLLTVYGQLVFKWQIVEAGPFPDTMSERLDYTLGLATAPWVVSVFVAALLASGTWALALTKFDLSLAYPFMSLSFVLVLILSAPFFSEAITATKVTGMALIVLGLIIGNQ